MLSQITNESQFARGKETEGSVVNLVHACITEVGVASRYYPSLDLGRPHANHWKMRRYQGLLFLYPTCPPIRGNTTMYKTKDLLNAIDMSGNMEMQKKLWRARLMDPDQSFRNDFSQPPQQLYKYIPERRLDDALPDEKPCSFRATPPKELNDINEINYTPTFFEDEDNRENINQQYASTLTELHPTSPITVEDVEEYRQKYPFGYGAELTCDQISKRYGITSFSAKFNDVKMWSFYADKCRGVVVGYNVDYWVRHMTGKPIIRRVVYMNDFPKIMGPLVVNEENVHGFMSVKGAVWEYEQEWRLITELSNTDRTPKGIETISCPQESVSSVHITHRTSQKTVDTITQRLNNPLNNYRIWTINKLQKGRETSTLAFAGQMQTRESKNKIDV